MSSEEAAPEASQAVALARGSSLAMSWSLMSSVFRFAVMWLLTRALGPIGYGVYAYFVTVGELVGSIATLGTGHGLILFASRARADGDDAAARGAIATGITGAFLGGLASSIGVFLMAPRIAAFVEAPALEATLQIGSPLPLVAALMFTIGHAAQAAKDTYGDVFLRLTMPGMGMVVTSALIWALGLDARAAAVALIFFQAVAIVLLVKRLPVNWPEVTRPGPITTDVRAFFVFSLPQAAVEVLHKVNVWADILMLGWLSTMEEVGLYRLVAALGIVGLLPMDSVLRLFRPMVAELAHASETERLTELSHTITRWLIGICGPIWWVIVALPDVILTVFGSEWTSSSSWLATLMLGYAMMLLGAPANTVVTMSGHSAVNAANGLAAAALNIALNYWLIPELGGLGAAIASTSAMTLWTAMRIVESRYLVGIWSLGWREVGLAAVGISWAFVLAVVLVDSPPLVRGATLLTGFPMWFLLLRSVAAPDDLDVASRIGAKVRALAQRRA